MESIVTNIINTCSNILPIQVGLGFFAQIVAVLFAVALRMRFKGYLYMAISMGILVGVSG